MDHAAKRGGLVHIVDGNPLARRGLDFMLRNAGYKTVAWSNGAEFLRSADCTDPACLLLDLQMPVRDGLAMLERLTRGWQSIAVIILTGHGEIEFAVEAMKAGARDFIEKPFAPDRLIGALDDGFAALADKEALRRNRDWAQSALARLTERERQVLHGLACGFPNKTIAHDLGISARTVEVYRAHVMAKLDSTSLAEVLAIAFAAGLGSKQQWHQVRQPQQLTMELRPPEEG